LFFYFSSMICFPFFNLILFLGGIRYCCIAQAVVELPILLPHFLEYWDHRCVPLSLAYFLYQYFIKNLRYIIIQMSDTIMNCFL
jgi:hypothetical protein